MAILSPHQLSVIFVNINMSQWIDVVAVDQTYYFP